MFWRHGHGELFTIGINQQVVPFLVIEGFPSVVVMRVGLPRLTIIANLCLAKSTCVNGVAKPVKS